MYRYSRCINSVHRELSRIISKHKRLIAPSPVRYFTFVVYKRHRPDTVNLCVARTASFYFPYKTSYRRKYFTAISRNSRWEFAHLRSSPRALVIERGAIRTHILRRLFWIRMNSTRERPEGGGEEGRRRLEFITDKFRDSARPVSQEKCAKTLSRDANVTTSLTAIAIHRSLGLRYRA